MAIGKIIFKIRKLKRLCSDTNFLLERDDQFQIPLPSLSENCYSLYWGSLKFRSTSFIDVS